MENNGLSPDLENVRKRAWLTAISLGTAVVASLMFLMYAFVQKSEADKQRAIAEHQTKLSEECQMLVVDRDNHEQMVIVALRSEIDSLKSISCK